MGGCPSDEPGRSPIWLTVVIGTLITARILIRFVGQIVALWLLLRHAP
jgi:hypothetical protein